MARLCDRKGWTLTQFFALSDAEQEFWRAYELRREQRLEALLGKVREVESFDRLAATVALLIEEEG